MLEMLRTRILEVLARVRREDAGAAMVEYGLLVGLIALIVAIGAQVLGQDISQMFNGIGSYLASLKIP